MMHHPPSTSGDARAAELIAMDTIGSTGAVANDQGHLGNTIDGARSDDLRPCGRPTHFVNAPRTKTRRPIASGIALVSTVLVLGASVAQADEPEHRVDRANRIELSDVELDLVTAGAATTESSEDMITFAATKTTASGRTVTADGSFRLVDAIDRETIGSLILSDGAQGNLRSLININAVNSEVNVLLNLNINIDSEVGTLNQLNLNGILPGQPNIRP